MYSSFSLKFTVREATKEIPYTIGVHQGDNLAPLLFIIFFQAVLDSLEKVWTEHSLPIPMFCYFPMAKSGKFCGRLRGQSIRIRKEFPFEKSLYVSDGAFLFTTRLELQK
eukprot:5074214-Ditylum_brightwellii.AAC.1